MAVNHSSMDALCTAQSKFEWARPRLDFVAVKSTQLWRIAEEDTDSNGYLMCDAASPMGWDATLGDSLQLSGWRSMDPAIQMGPMARADLRDSLHKQVEGSVAAGARVLCGGKPKDGKGAFYIPTVLSGVTQGMPAFDDETFGPVAAITPSRMSMQPSMLQISLD